VIAAQGELQASQTLAEAAATLAQEPSAIQLRYLQTVTEIAAENNSTTIFPIPIDLITPFMKGAIGRGTATAARAGASESALPGPNPLNALPSFKIEESKVPKKEQKD